MGILGRVSALVAATHPVPAVSVTVLAGALAAARGAAAATLAWVVICTASGQASVGWSNDYVDHWDDARAGRTSKPIVAGRVPAGVVGRAAVLALAGCLLAAVPLGPAAVASMGAAVASAWLYNVWLKATLWSWAPYAVSFGLLVVFVWVATGGAPPAWVVAAGALLGVAGHHTNVLPDLEQDLAAGRTGLPHRLGAGPSLLLACGALAGALVIVLAGGRTGAARWVPAAAAGALIAGVAAAVLAGRKRAGFRLTIAAAAAVAAVVALTPEALAR